MRFLATALLLSATVLAQTEPSFDVVSIRRNMSGHDGGGGRPRGGGYTFTNVTVRSLISLGYGLPFDRILGGPSWMASDRYDIDASGKESTTLQETGVKVRSLLRDRFRLAVHMDRRDLPVYLLVLARADGRLGPGLRRSSVDCTDPEARRNAVAAARDARIVCGLTFDPGVFTAGGVAISTILGELTAASGRAVIDRTGLTGNYNIELKWTPQPDPNSDNVSIFTAVQEQLGLKLESGSAPLDVVVIDRIERPTEN
jgi:uncharacterized protein (TIGR03435 family)